MIMSNGRQIALAAMSAAYVIVFAVIGNYLNNFIITFGVLTSLAIAMPVNMKQYKCALAAYIVASAILLILSPFRAMFFVCFFGIYPLLYSLLDKIKKLYIRYLLKAIYYLASLIVHYYITGNLYSVNIINYIEGNNFFFYYLLIGVLILFIYDFMWGKLNRIIISKLKLIHKYVE